MEEHIEKLKQLLCEATDCEAKTPSDFRFMSVFIQQRTREIIGINTLKRLYNYQGESAVPRMQTLNILSMSLGYHSFDDFIKHYNDTGESSDIVLGPHISTSHLTIGNRILLRWNPGRECVIQYIGNETYRVVSSEKTKLVVGDTFQASFFAVGHIAMLSNLINNNVSFPLYEIGKLGGLTLVEQIKD